MRNKLREREFNSHMDRLKYFSASQGISLTSFVSMCKLGDRFFSKSGNLLVPSEWKDIILTYPQLNIYWVLFEEGKMLIDRNSAPKYDTSSLEERWNVLLDDMGMSANMLEKELNFSKSAIKRMYKSIPIDRLEVIHSSYPQLNIEYILCGFGGLYDSRPKELARTTIIPNDIEEPILPTRNMRIPTPVLYDVPVLPVSAFGGGLCGEGAQVMMRDCDKLRLPFKADLGVTIVGTSMVDTSGDRIFMTDYHPGDTVFIEKMNPDEPIQWGDVYVLDTKDGIIVKILKKSDKEDTVICESINKAYQPFEVPISIINNFYKIVSMMRLIKR